MIFPIVLQQTQVHQLKPEAGFDLAHQTYSFDTVSPPHTYLVHLIKARKD
jgi:hypothetical protein